MSLKCKFNELELWNGANNLDKGVINTLQQYINTFSRTMSARSRSDTMISIHVLTHWGRVTQICVSKLTIIGSDNGLSPGRRQAIIWTNGGILLIRSLGTNFSEISSEIHTFSFKKMHLKTSSAKWRPFCLGLNLTDSDVGSTNPQHKRI